MGYIIGASGMGGSRMSKSEFLSYLDKCNEYTDYIANHIANVRKAFYKLFFNKMHPVYELPNLDRDKTFSVLNMLGQIIKDHDQSKYSDYEFPAYRRKWYPTEQEKEAPEEKQKLADEEYEAAWHHHYTHNDHHPRFWKWIEDERYSGQMHPTISIRKTPRDVALPMSYLAILHMICDWEAMTMAKGGSLIDWYNNKATSERADMNPETKVLLEAILCQLYDVGPEAFKDQVKAEPPHVQEAAPVVEKPKRDLIKELMEYNSDNFIIR